MWGLNVKTWFFTLLYSTGWDWQASDKEYSHTEKLGIAGQPVPSREEGALADESMGAFVQEGASFVDSSASGTPRHHLEGGEPSWC